MTEERSTILYSESRAVGVSGWPPPRVGVYHGHARLAAVELDVVIVEFLL
jgi:hypothetical protein